MKPKHEDPIKNTMREETHTRRPEAVRIADRKRISRLLTLGHSQSEIAELMGLSEPTISREVARLKDSFKQKVRQNLHDMQANELERIDEIEQAAWLRHGKTGSVEALNTILKCIQTRATILGLDTVDSKELMRRANDIKSAIIRVLTEEIQDTDLLIRIASRLQEAGSEYQPSAISQPEELVPRYQDNELSSPTLGSDARPVAIRRRKSM